jgi:hypothetical protein
MDTSPKASLRENSIKFVDNLLQLVKIGIAILIILFIGAFALIRTQKQSELTTISKYLNNQLNRIKTSVEDITFFYVSYLEATQKPSLDQLIANSISVKNKLIEIDNSIKSERVPKDFLYQNIERVNINPLSFLEYNDSLIKTSSLHISLMNDMACVINGVRDLDKYIEENQLNLSKEINNFESSISSTNEFALYFNDLSSKSNLLFSCYQSEIDILTQEQSQNITSLLKNINSISTAYALLKDSLSAQNDPDITKYQNEIASLTTTLDLQKLEDITSTDILIKRYGEELKKSYETLNYNYNNIYTQYSTITSILLLPNDLQKVRFSLN